MQKVKAKQTLHGSYGQKLAGDEFEVTDSVAKSLEEKGLVEITGAAEGDDAATEKANYERTGDKTSVRFTDNTGKEKKNIDKPGTTATEKKEITKPTTEQKKKGK